MNHKPYSLNVQLGPLFTLKCVNNSGLPSQVVQIVVGAKTSSLFTNTSTVDVSITAAAPLAAFRAVTITGEYVQPNCESLSSYAGVTQNSYAPGIIGSVVRAGLLQGGGPWIPNQPVYVTDNGVLTQTLNFPEWRRIGFAVSTSQVNLDPFPFLELSSANW